MLTSMIIVIIAFAGAFGLLTYHWREDLKPKSEEKKHFVIIYHSPNTPDITPDVEKYIKKRSKSIEKTWRLRHEQEEVACAKK